MARGDRGRASSAGGGCSTSARHVEADPINPQLVFHELSPRLPDRAIVLADSGSATNWWARHLRLRRGMDAALSGTLATMCPAVPYALAAKLAYPRAPGDRLPRRRRDADARHQRADRHRRATTTAGPDPRLVVARAQQRRPQPGDVGAARAGRRRRSSRRRRTCRRSTSPPTPSSSACEGIRVETPERGRAGVGRARSAADRPVRDRRRHRPRGPAAAAAHPLRAGARASRGRCCTATPTRRRDHAPVACKRARSRSCVDALSDRGVIDGIEAEARTIPTDGPSPTGRSSGTTTTIVLVRVRAGGETGIGYTYGDALGRPT